MKYLPHFVLAKIHKPHVRKVIKKEDAEQLQKQEKTIR